MSDTIASLELEVSSNAQGASSGLDALTQSLGRLKTATSGGAGLTSVANSLKKISDATKGLGDVSGLTKVGSAISKLNGLKVSSTVGNGIKNIGEAVKGLQGVDFSGVGALAEGLSPLATISAKGFNSAVNALRKLPEAVNAIDLRTLYTQIQSLTRIMRPLAVEMEKIAQGFSAFPSRIQKLIVENEKLASSQKKVKESTSKASFSFTDFYHKIKMAYSAVKSIGSGIGKAIKETNNYIENVNLFDVALRGFEEEARNYAEQVSDIVGIDPSEWIRSQGVFMTLARGFGVAGERAYAMSKNLTQLGYDISSFYNLDVEDAMTKLQSGLSGELEPLRRLGFDLSQAKLQAIALGEGITKSVSSMTQAEKAELRYLAIMTQVEESHGDMARTLDQPANQLRILRAQFTQLTRAIGSVFIPLLNKVVPYLIAGTKVLREMVSAVAALVGFTMPEVDYSSITDGANDTTDALDEATESAKKLRDYTMGFDELNVISPSSEADDSSLDGTGFGFELPEYDFLKNVVTTEIDEIVKKMKDWLGITGDIKSWSDLFKTNLGEILITVGSVGAGILGWKLSKSFLAGLETFTVALGLGLLVSSISVTWSEGLNLKSIIEGAVGGALIGAGLGFKFGGWQGAIGGVIIGIGLSLVVNGITSMLAEGVNTENVVTTVTGVLATVGGIITAVKLFNSKHKNPLPELDTATETISGTNTGMGNLSLKLKDLAITFAWGLLIIAEVAAAATLIVGAIAILGWELEQVGKAWQPVIDNGETILSALGLGTTLLLAVGLVTGLLGTAGGALAAQMGIGIAILAEMGVATLLFVAEIWAIGKGLEQVGIAWQPVLDNGKTIEDGIVLGTALLVAIGVVTAALGVATVATAGALPLAIGLGTAILVELGIAFVAFVKSLVAVADSLSNDLHPALVKLNAKLPTLTRNMEKFTGFMIEFAEQVVVYTASSAISGFSATVDSIVKFFTKDPVKVMADDVAKMYKHTVTLNEKLEEANPELETAIGLMTTYYGFLEKLEELTGKTTNINLAEGMFVSMKEVGKKLVTGFVKGIKDEQNELAKQVKKVLGDTFTTSLAESYGKSFGKSLGSAIASAIKATKFPTISGSISTSDNGSVSVSFNAYAMGGFPEAGEIFIAREAGAEMVGTIGRKTAVVNNDQIVSGIANGVAEANGEQNVLLREQNTLLRALLEKEGNVYLDGRKVTETVDRHHRERGRTIMVGGAY